MSESKPKSGNQYTIASGDYSATVTQQGATLRKLTWKGKDIVVPFAPDETVSCCHGYVLVPYPNRLEDGSYEFNEHTYRFPIDEPALHNSIHGQGYRYFWNLESLAASDVTLSWRAPNLASYPFDITVTAHYAISENGLSVSIRATNNDITPAPWALGFHPWLANGKGRYGNAAIEQDNALCSLQLDCATHVRVNDRLLPVGTESVDGTIYDLRNAVTLEGRPFDDAWINPKRNDEGSTQAVFKRPDGIMVTLTGDSTVNAWQVCTASGFPDESHPAGVAVEPMTAYANAFRRPNAATIIEPGDSTETTISYSVTQG